MAAELLFYFFNIKKKLYYFFICFFQWQLSLYRRVLNCLEHEGGAAVSGDAALQQRERHLWVGKIVCLSTLVLRVGKEVMATCAILWTFVAA